jgi:pimeloyl-ACP methyl ester carboxylesterase
MNSTGLETDPEALIATERGRGLTEAETLDLCRAVRCPALVTHGGGDAMTSPERGMKLAGAISGARSEMIRGGELILLARDPVRVNLLIRDITAAIGRAGS